MSTVNRTPENQSKEIFFVAELAIGHLKSNHRMDRCWLPDKLGDALHAVLCAAGYNLRWLMRAIRHLGLKNTLLPLVLLQLINSFYARRPYIGMTV